MIPFRTRRALRTLLVTLLILVLLISALLICWLLWLNRYVVYTREGIRLDFDRPGVSAGGQTPQAPAPGMTVDIYYNEGQNTVVPPTNELAALTGQYVDGEMLVQDFAQVSGDLAALDRGTAILVDMKNIRSEFYYATALGRVSGDVPAEEVAALIAQLKSKGHYLIARIPAFQEYWYILDDEQGRVPLGLPKEGGSGSLWMDPDGPCYWLNPSADGTLTYLVQIIGELRAMGFDEVVLQDFRFPNTDMIAFSGDRETAITNLAYSLAKICTTDSFCLSFQSSNPAFPLPQGRTRLYLTGAAAAEAQTLAEQTGLETGRLVFLTDLLDTRFDSFSTMRPLGTSAES